MGQRHQIFIHTLNGAKVIAKDQKKKLDKERKNEFGDNDTTVLAYHHQWLYGFSAAIQALHVLEFNRDANEYHTPFTLIEYGGLLMRFQSAASAGSSGADPVTMPTSTICCAVPMISVPVATRAKAMSRRAPPAAKSARH